MPPSQTTTSKRAAAAAQKALDNFQAKMDKTYGPGKFLRGAQPEPYRVISTGSLDLDRKLRVGGYVLGRITEIWGPEGAGKTSLAIIGMVEAQKAYPDKFVGFIDMEHRRDLAWMESHGLDLKRTFIIQPDNAEEVADMVKDMCRQGIFSMVVVDSIGAMVTEQEKEIDAAKANVAGVPKVVTRMVKIAAVEADKAGTVVLLLNQVRALIGGSPKGPDTTTGGGWALKHGTTMKLAVRRAAQGALVVGSGDKAQQVGHMIAVKVERNSVALAFGTAKFGFLYVDTDTFGPKGIDRAMEAADIGVELGLIEQAGAWYTNRFTGERYNGKQKLVEGLRADADTIVKIRDAALDISRVDVVYDGGPPLDDGEMKIEMESGSSGSDDE